MEAVRVPAAVTEVAVTEAAVLVPAAVTEAVLPAAEVLPHPEAVPADAKRMNTKQIRWPDGHLIYYTRVYVSALMRSKHIFRIQ